MAGYTGFSVGIVRNSVSMIPVTTLIKAGVNRLSMFDRTWQRLMAQNRQLSMVNEDFEELAKVTIEARREERCEVLKKIVSEVK